MSPEMPQHCSAEWELKCAEKGEKFHEHRIIIIIIIIYTLGSEDPEG